MIRRILHLKDIKVTYDTTKLNCLTWHRDDDTFSANISSTDPKTFVKIMISMYEIALKHCGYKKRDIKREVAKYHDKSTIRPQ